MQRASAPTHYTHLFDASSGLPMPIRPTSHLPANVSANFGECTCIFCNFYQARKFSGAQRIHNSINYAHRPTWSYSTTTAVTSDVRTAVSDDPAVSLAQAFNTQCGFMQNPVLQPLPTTDTAPPTGRTKPRGGRRRAKHKNVQAIVSDQHGYTRMHTVQVICLSFSNLEQIKQKYDDDWAPLDAAKNEQTAAYIDHVPSSSKIDENIKCEESVKVSANESCDTIMRLCVCSQWTTRGWKRFAKWTPRIRCARRSACLSTAGTRCWPKLRSVRTDRYLWHAISTTHLPNMMCVGGAQ